MTMRFLAAALAVCAVLTFTAAAQADPLAALPVGASVKFHLTSQTTDQSGTQNASHYVSFTRMSPGTIGVTLDGAPGGKIVLQGGNATLPPQSQDALKPFGLIATLLRGLPKPPANGASWSANVAIPVGDQTDNLPVVMTVTQLSPQRVTIVGTGNNATGVQHGARSLPADVGLNATIALNANGTLSSASGSTTIGIHAGRGGRRDKQFGSSWTITRVNP
jgi:hypothetical protein